MIENQEFFGNVSFDFFLNIRLSIFKFSLEFKQRCLFFVGFVVFGTCALIPDCNRRASLKYFLMKLDFVGIKLLLMTFTLLPLP